MSYIYELSTQNDGSWGNQGETDEDVVRFSEKLAELVADNWPGIDLEVRLVDGPVSRRQSGCDGVLAEAIRAFVNDHYGEAIDLALANGLDDEDRHRQGYLS
jgi:hypothetical protein